MTRSDKGGMSVPKNRTQMKWSGGVGVEVGGRSGAEAHRGMNKRASGIEGEGDLLRQRGCEWEKLLSLSVRPGPTPPTRAVSLRGRKCSGRDNAPELSAHTYTLCIKRKAKGCELCYCVMLSASMACIHHKHTGADNEHMACSDHFTSARWVIWNLELPK